MNSPILKVSVIFYVRVIMSGGDASRFIFTFPLQVAMKSKKQNKIKSLIGSLSNEYHNVYRSDWFIFGYP